MGENKSIMSESMWSKRISLLGLSLSAALLTLLFLIVTGAADARSAANPAQQDVQPQQPELFCSADLLSYWKLDETSGTEFSDMIGGNDASCSGSSCPEFDTGRVDGALAFDGVNDGLTAPDAPEYSWTGSDSFSIELWVKTPSCDNGSDPEGTVFLGKHAAPTAGSSSWWLGCDLNGGGRAAFSLRDSTTSSQERIVASSLLADNQWHHLVGVHDGASSEMRLYVDGTLEITKTRAFAGDFENSKPITFGYHDNKYRANAVIDEVAIYDAALSESEIQAHYDKGQVGLDYCNQAPIAKNGSYTTAIDVPVTITLAYDDLDGPGPFTFTIVDPPDHGALSGSAPNLTYTPDTGFTGNDSFIWRVHDGLEDSDVATIGILVSTTGENEPPVGTNQTESTPSNTPLALTLAYSDPDNGPGPYEFTIVNGPDHGALSAIDEDGNLTYTPDTNYVGGDSFTWRVSDGIAESNTATVSITVQNQAPLAESNNYTTARGASVVVQLQYSDPDQAPGPYTFIIVDQPQHGALSGTGAERTYTPASGYVGSDSFTWRVNDGVSDSNLATITINVVEEEQWIYLPLIFKSSP